MNLINELMQSKNNALILSNYLKLPITTDSNIQALSQTNDASVSVIHKRFLELTAVVGINRN
jgi:hypothetical protein